MTAQTIDDPEVMRQGLEALIASVEDQIADTLMALGQAAEAGSDAGTIADLAKQAQALSDHRQELRRDLAATEHALMTRRAFDDLRAALLSAIDAIDQLQATDGPPTVQGEAAPIQLPIGDLRQVIGALRLHGMRPAIVS